VSAASRRQRDRPGTASRRGGEALPDHKQEIDACLFRSAVRAASMEIVNAAILDIACRLGEVEYVLKRAASQRTTFIANP
jgi:hypothetical protein